MLLNVSLDEAMERIGPAAPIFDEEVIPGRVPEADNSPYLVEYNWLFTIERRLAALLEKWLRPYRYELIGQKGVLCEALSNAFSHGHQRDPYKPINVRIIVGRQGLIVSIQDSGRGFDVGEVFSGFQKKKRYFSTAGNGFRLMVESTVFGIFYSDSGAAFHLIHLFDQADGQPSTWMLDHLMPQPVNQSVLAHPTP